MSAYKFTPDQHLAVARMLTRKYLPYMSAAVMALIPRKTPGLATLAVSATGVLVWDPDFATGLPLDQLAGVLLHEANHLIRAHHTRAARSGAEPHTWNLAADYEINDDLRAARVPLPEYGAYPDQEGLPAGRTCEEYYRLLREKQQTESPPKLPEKPLPAGGWDGSGAGCPVPGEPTDDKAPPSAQPQGEPGEGQPSPGPTTPGRSEADLQRVRNQVAQAIQAHAQTHGIGSVPEGYRVWAGQHLAPPKVRWQDLLRRAVRSGVAAQRGMTDYTYARPSRRQSAYDGCDGQVILPAMASPLPQVGIGLDTSGSMGGAAIERAAAEIGGILKTIKASAQFIACDSAVHAITKIKSPKDFAGAFRGGGGTSFVPVFEAMQRLKPRPNTFVFLTDGQGDAPAAPPPGIRVIWVLCGPYKTRPTVAGQGSARVDWGAFIEIDE